MYLRTRDEGAEEGRLTTVYARARFSVLVNLALACPDGRRHLESIYSLDSRSLSCNEILGNDRDERKRKLCEGNRFSLFRVSCGKKLKDGRILKSATLSNDEENVVSRDEGFPYIMNYLENQSLNVYKGGIYLYH